MQELPSELKIKCRSFHENSAFNALDLSKWATPDVYPIKCRGEIPLQPSYVILVFSLWDQ